MLSAETSLDVDLNQDTITGVPHTPGGTTINGVNLGTSSFGYTLRDGTSAPVLVNFNGGQVASNLNPGGGWSAIAAAVSVSGYDLYWRNSHNGLYARWNINSSGALSTGGLLSIPELLSAETSLGVDLNQDSITGVPHTPGATTIHGVNLGFSSFGYTLLL
ncbi:MAG: hypothetical protein ACKOPS_09765, partial [Cyanobium sp.]